MRKIFFYLFWTVFCLHTTVSFTEAANSTTESSLAEIAAIIAESQVSNIAVTNTGSETDITLDSAPQSTLYNTAFQTNTSIEYTAWELIHRTFMMQGFMLGGDMANYVTPAMYIGTPLATNQSTLGYNADIGATNYFECVRAESDASFGPVGVLIENTTENELKNIAKYCAIEFYGSYFEGKKYTTREEMIMLLFTMFDEDVHLAGHFDGKQFIFDGREVEVPFENISPRAWYAPYVSRAYDYFMTEDESTWNIAAEVTDADITMMLDMYMLDNSGLVSSTISTQYGIYMITQGESGLNIKKNHDTTLVLNAASHDTNELSPDEDISDEALLAGLLAE